VYSLQRTALLVLALVEGDLDALPRALDDRLHQPDRAALTPMFCQHPGARGRTRAYAAHSPARGPGTLLWVRAEQADEIAARVSALLPDAQVPAARARAARVLVSGQSA